MRALAGLDVEIEAGELLALLGPNGAGKSSLLRVLAGLVPATRGEVRLDGRGLDELGSRRRARTLAYVPQDLALVPEVTVETFVLGGRYAHLGAWSRPRREDRDAVERALAAADVGDLPDRLLPELSGGQRQRVLVARALAQEAEVLLVDEPTSSLDPEHQIGVFRLLADLAGRGRAVAVVTHDLNLASLFASRLVLLCEGQVRARGRADEVLRAEVLEPVYGPWLRFIRLPTAAGEERPLVLPWPGSP